MNGKRCINFLKMHSCGNDFIIIQDKDFSEIPDSDHCRTIKELSNRRTGIGCDQLLVFSNEIPSEGTVLIYNSDGSPAATCINGTACVALELMRKNKEYSSAIKSSGGIFSTHLEKGKVKIIPNKILQSRLPTKDKKLSNSLSKFSLPEIKYPGIGVSMGNPHLILFVETAREVNEIKNFVTLIHRNNPFTRDVNISLSYIFNNVALSRVIEAGSGETLACGSAAAAIYLAARNLNLVEGELTIRFPGGDLITGPYEESCYVITNPKYAFSGSFWIPL